METFLAGLFGLISFTVFATILALVITRIWNHQQKLADIVSSGKLFLKSMISKLTNSK